MVKPVDVLIKEIAEVAGLKPFVTYDGEIRFIQTDTDNYERWSFQVQLADFLNTCLDNPIQKDGE